MNAVKPEVDHRTRVGAQRRERTRARLIQSALRVFAEKGPEAAVIDDVISLAGMSRGSFYNYFLTNAELLEAVATALSDELFCVIDEAVRVQKDPLLCLAMGLRMGLHAMRRYRLVGAFMSRLRWPQDDGSLAALGFLKRDLREAYAAGKLAKVDPDVAVDLIVGATLCACHALARGATAADYPDRMTEAMLLGLAVAPATAARLAHMPLPPFVAPADGGLLHSLDGPLTPA